MFAAIDIGTNSVLMLIGEALAGGKIKVVSDEMRITRLGEGVSASRCLNDKAIKRTFEALKSYQEICDKLNATKVIAVATDVLRKSSDANKFLNLAKTELGLDVKVIPPEHEAWLTYLASSREFGDDIIVCDIGGGSTEIIWSASKTSSKVPVKFVSMPIGCVNLTEQFIKSDPPTKEEISELTAAIEQNLNQITHISRHPQKIVACGGTAATLAAMQMNMHSYNPAKIHGSFLETLDLQVAIESLKRKTVLERQKMAGLTNGREDVIFAGAILLERLMRKMGYDVLTISDHGLRWGLFIESFLNPADKRFV